MADQRGHFGLARAGWCAGFTVKGLKLGAQPPGKQWAATGSKQDKFPGLTLNLQVKMVFVLRREAGRRCFLRSGTWIKHLCWLARTTQAG